MYIAPVDMAVIKSDELRNLQQRYYEKFGERFIKFNYADFAGTHEKCAGQMYKEALEKAVEADEPYHIVSHRYDIFDH